jgi:hypothetical protein
MLTKISKWTMIILGSLVLLAVVLVGVLSAIGNARLVKKYDVQPEPVTIPTDEESIARGSKWAAVLCADCHGSDFSGAPLVDDPVMGFIPAPNLTAGEGGIGGEHPISRYILAASRFNRPLTGLAWSVRPERYERDSV